MKAKINLKTSDSILVMDIKTIKMHKTLNTPGKELSEDNLENFYIERGRAYSFIGTNSVAVNGEDILTVEFCR